MSDLISRQAAIDAVKKNTFRLTFAEEQNYEGHVAWSAYAVYSDVIEGALLDLPFAQPTLYGYNIEHLELIARVLQKEDLPPERIAEVLTDIGRIVAIVKDEFEETLRKAAEQWMN